MHKKLVYQGHIYEFQTDLFLNDDEAKAKYSEYLTKSNIKDVLEKYAEFVEVNSHELNLNELDAIQEFNIYVLDELESTYNIEDILNYFKVPFKKITTSNSEVVLVTKEYAITLSTGNTVQEIMHLNQLANEIEKHPENFIPKEIIDDIDKVDFNNTFWQNPKPLYTQISSRRVVGLNKKGLHPTDQGGWRSEIKTTTNLKTLYRYSNEVTIQINTELMKEDRYLPKVSQADIVETLPILAKIVDYYELNHLINIPELNEDAEEQADIVIIRNAIPGKYLIKLK